MVSKILFLLLLVFILKANSKDVPCLKRDFGHGSFVCVCNSSYCDNLNISDTKYNKLVQLYTSTKSELRFNFTTVEKSSKNISSKTTGSTKIVILKEKRFQKIKGFGGALTDSAALNIKSLNEKAQKKLLESYFSSNGIEYNMIRIPMASSDYSTRPYTYLDTVNDFNLTTFKLEEEDVKYKIPLLKEIFNISATKLSLYASPWTAPSWMKTNNNEVGLGRLKGKTGDKYHRTWAQYFIKFLDSYKEYGINFWGLTAQNEPSNGLLIPSRWQSCGWSAGMQRDFIKTDLGPALHQSNYKDIKLMILDDQRLFMPSFIRTVCDDEEANKYVSGIGVHWYWNWLMPPSVLKTTHDLFPDKFILATEACNKDSPPSDLGSWDDGVKYSKDILDNLNNWAIGWVDWNLCLNLKGGPNWANNFDGSPIIVNASIGEFYKQPMFYHMGHFSKFIKEGFQRIDSYTDKSSNLKFVAAVSPDDFIVLVILNDSNNSEDVIVETSTENFNITIPPNSIQTLKWKSI